MKKFTQTTLIALLIGTFVFAQKGSPGNQAAPSQTTVIVGALRGSVILLSPADGKSIAASDASKPVLFRWTAVSPKPKEAVTYRLKVWQLMQGQNAAEAMRTHQPIVTKDVVNITQAAISNLYTGPCKPPYLCDFIWAVEVLNSEGVSIGNSHAGSNSNSFRFDIENQNPVKAEADNKGNAGNTGMAGGKSLNANGDSGFKYKTYQPGKPVYGNASLSPAPGKSIDKELDKNQPNAKRTDKELDKNQPNTKSKDKEVDKGNPPAAKSNNRCIHCDHRLNKNGVCIKKQPGPAKGGDVKPEVISKLRKPSASASWELYEVKFPCNCFWCDLKRPG